MILNPTVADLELPNQTDSLRVNLRARVHQGDSVEFEGGATYLVQGVQVVMAQDLGGTDQSAIQVQLGL